jgi:hypothetical protein
MNRIRRIIITFLAVIAVAGIIHFTSKPAQPVQPVEVAPSADVPELKPAALLAAPLEQSLTVYYSANDKNHELLVREAVSLNFPEELKKGAVVFKAIGQDSPEYPQLLQAFKPVVPAVILSVNSGGKIAGWKNITPPDFKDRTGSAEYIAKELRLLLKK